MGNEGSSKWPMPREMRSREKGRVTAGGFAASDSPTYLKVTVSKDSVGLASPQNALDFGGHKLL